MSYKVDDGEMYLMHILRPSICNKEVVLLDGKSFIAC